MIYKEEHSSLLDTLPVLEDNKFDIRAIPLVENDRLHSIIVRFKDIELISEEYDMGYKESISLLSEINGIPVKYIGVGEKIDDLQKFDPDEYINALFSDFDLKSDEEILADEYINKDE